MGNNIVSSVVKVFDRQNMEIDSISAKIYREQINGCHEKHEIYVENPIGIFRTDIVAMNNSGKSNCGSPTQVDNTQKHKQKLFSLQKRIGMEFRTQYEYSIASAAGIEFEQQFFDEIILNFRLNCYRKLSLNEIGSEQRENGMTFRLKIDRKGIFEGPSVKNSWRGIALFDFHSFLLSLRNQHAISRLLSLLLFCVGANYGDLVA